MLWSLERTGDSAVRRLHRWGAGGKMCLYSEREVLEDELCNRKDNKGIKGKKEDYTEGTFGKNRRE